MSCGHSSATPGCLSCGSDDTECVQAQPILPPAKCSDDANTKAEGPPGIQGDTGDTPAFTVGTVTEGAANVILTENTPTDYTVDFVIPQPPTGTANTWTAVQTFEQQAVFQLGLETTGGTSTFGGTAFTVTPNSNFDGDLNIAGDVDITGDLDIGGNFASVTSFTALNGFFHNALFDGQITFGASAAMVLDQAAAGSFPRGYIVLNDCNAPALVPNRGGDYYQKTEGTGLNTIATIDSGSMCSAFSVTVPISACTPQVTPVVTVEVRIGYNMSGSPIGNIAARLWQGAITSGTLLDQFVQGDVTSDNATGGCIILRGGNTLNVGATSFFIEIVNNTDKDFIPSSATFWATNT